MSVVIATLTTYVAINTLVFLGLSLAKGVRWPPPLHPVAVRSRTTAGHGGGHAQRATLMERTLLMGLAAMHAARTAVRERR